MKQDEVIQKSLQYIEENLEEAFSVRDIASEIGYSEFYFSRIFKEYMGLPVMEYVKKRKMIKASEMILAGNKIIDVAFMLGWQSHAGFTKAFKNEFGFYPSILRAMLMEMEYCGGRTMGHLFLRKPGKHLSKEELFAILQNEVSDNGIEYDQEELRKHCELSYQVYNGMKRYSGDEYVTHPLNVAILLTELNADKNVIMAGLFCDSLRKTKITEQELGKVLPKETISIISRVNLCGNDVSRYDDGVMLVKLAERLHNMRTIEFMDRAEREKRAKETFDIFMPLARKLGNDKLVSELNDLVLKHM